MLLIDGLGLGVNWQRFLSETLDPVVAPPPPPPPKKDDPAAGPANPTVTPPIPVTATPSTDPSKPTNAEIQSATALIQSMAAQYTPPPPDITVENDKTTAVQKAIQDAQTKYDNASQALQGAQNVLHLANRDPETTADERKTAQADYAKARTAADTAQRELNVTTDAGYMILYGEQANADMPAGMKIDDSGKVTDPGDAQHAADQQLKTLLAAFPDHPDDPNWVPQASDCKNPLQIRAYDDWQTAQAHASAGSAKYFADVANSNLAYAQFQSTLADPDYKAALDAGVGRLNDALQPFDLQVSMPDPPDSADAAQKAVTAAAKDANYANAALAAANDNVTLARAQQQSDADNGKDGPTVIVPGAIEKDKTALDHAQVAAGTSSSYLQMLAAQQQADTLQANYNGKLARLSDDPSDPYRQLQLAKQQASIAHDAFVVAYGTSLAQQYDDQAAQIEATVKPPARTSPFGTANPSQLFAPPPWNTTGTPANGTSKLPGAAPLFSSPLPTTNAAGAPNGSQPLWNTSPLLNGALPYPPANAAANPATPSGPTLLDAKRLRVAAGAIRAADNRLSNLVNERATGAALTEARNQQSQKHAALATIQQQYDDWQAAHPAPLRIRKLADGDILPAYTPPLPNPNQSQLDQAKKDAQNADNTVQRLQLLSESAHQQVLLDQFDAGLDERLRYAAPDSDAYKDYQKAQHDFYEAHRSELSNTLLDAASASTGNGATIDFGKLSDTQQRNLIGVALGMEPDVAGDPSSNPSIATDTQTHFTNKDKLSTIDGVRDKLLKIGGGAATQINVLPIVYAAKDAGMQTTAMFKVKDKDGDTQFVDETASTYNDINDYIDNNELSSDGTVDIATGHNDNGTLQITSRAAHHDSGFDSLMKTLTGTKVNLGMLIGGMVLEGIGGVLDATGVGLPLGATLNVVGAGMTYTSIAATMTSSALDIKTRLDHGRSINPLTDPGARADFINLVPMGAAGAAKLAGSKLFTRTVTALTRTPKVASVFRGAMKATAITTGAIGAGESFVEAGVDYWNHDTKAGNQALVGGVTNLALMGAGGLKERAVTSVVKRTGRPFAARTPDGRTVTVDGRTIGRLLNQGDDASLAAGRNRATFDGERVTVAPDGTLRVGDKILTYEDQPIRVLDGASRNALPAGKSVVLGDDGKLSVVSASDKNWTNGTRVDSVTDTGERLSFGPGGRMSATPKILARTPLDLLDSALQQARDEYVAARGEQAPRSLAQAAQQGETASAANDARSTRRTSEERARVDAQQDERAAEHVTDANLDRRSADAQAMRYRPLDTDAPAGALARATPTAARPRVDIRVVDLTGAEPAARAATADPAGISVPRGPGAEPLEVGGRTLYIVRDGDAPHAASPATARAQNFDEPIVVVAGERDAQLAPELANRWQKPVYAATPDAFGADGQLRTDARMLRFDPAPDGVAVAGGPAGGDAAEQASHAAPARDANDGPVIVLAGKRGPNAPAMPRPAATPQPMKALDGRFSPPNRVLVLVRPERAAAPERAPAHDESAPARSRADGAHPRPVSDHEVAGAYDADLVAAHPETTEAAPPDAAASGPGWFTRMQMRFGGAPVPEAARALAGQSATLVTQLRMLSEAGWRVKVGKRGGGSHIDSRKRVMTIDGALQDPGSITYTLASEARQAVEAMAGVLNLDYGSRGRFTRKALEAQARAQINAFEARYEIALSTGVDIAEHAHLPDAIAREGVDWHGPTSDYTGTVARLADNVADAPVSGRDEQTYREFYDDVWSRQQRRGGIPHRMPVPRMHAGDGRDGTAPAGRQHLDERTAWSYAHAVFASPFGDGPAPDAATLQARRDGHLSTLADGNVLMLHADTLPDGTLLVDGQPVGAHEYAIAMAPWHTVKQADAIVLSAGHGGYEAAARLSNVWRRAVYAPPEHAAGADATVHDARVFRRFDPAPAAPHALGELAADADGVHLDGDPATRIDIDGNVGELLGAGARKTAFALGDDAALATVDRSPPPPGAPQEPLTPEAQRAANEQLVIDEQRALAQLEQWGIRTVRLDGPFRALGERVSALSRPLGVFHSDEFATGRLPPALSRAGIRNVVKLRELLTQFEIGFDLQGIFTRTGDFLVCDPGPILHTYAAHALSQSRLFEIEKGMMRWIELHGEDALDSQRDTTPVADDAFVQKPSVITRVRMRVGGAPLPVEVSALAQRSGTLATQLRMLDANGWRVKVGKRGGGSRIDTKRKRVTIDGAAAGPGWMTYVLAHEAKHAVDAIEGTLGLDYSGRGRFVRTALEAEARAQLSAFEARYEIRMASGVDIAAKVRLPDALQAEADAWQTARGNDGALARLVDAFADAPVSGGRGKTYAEFYGNAYERGPGRRTRAMPAPETRAARDGGDAPPSMREIQAQRAAWSQAHAEHDASPFGAGGPPAVDTLALLRDGRVLLDVGQRIAIVPADTLRDGTLLGPDGQPVDPHEFTLLNAPPSDPGYTTILSARHANEGAAAQLANLWQRAIYTVHPDTIGAGGLPDDLSGLNRYRPASYRQPSLGELSVDSVHRTLYRDGDPARPADPADFLGPVLGSGAYKTVFDGGAGQAIGVYRDGSIEGLADAYEAVELEQDGLRMLKEAYELPTSTTDGPFSVANRVGVVLKPSAQLSSVDVEFDIGLPAVVSSRGLADLARIRRVTQAHHLLYDFQVLFGRNGDVMLHDPGEVMPGADPDGSVLGRIDEVAAKIHSGIAHGRIKLAHPAFDEAGAYAPRRGAIARVVMTFRGIVLTMQAHALARRSPTLRAQMRLARADGWKVKLGAPDGGQYVDAARRRIVLDGNTRRAGTLVFALAHEAQHSVDLATDTLGLDRSSHDAYVKSLLLAEARAQLNAYRVRAEILAAGGPDIAMHVQLPPALARAAEHAFASGDPAALDALADAFGEMRTSLPGRPTYRALYGEQARADLAGAPAPLTLAAPARGGARAGGARRGRYALDSAEMTRARAWLDARGMRTLKRIDGADASSLRTLVRQAGVDTALLITRAGKLTPATAPDFVATARIDANGAITAPRFIGRKLTPDEQQSLAAALDAAHDAAQPAQAAAARAGFAFHASPVPLTQLQALGGVSKIEHASDGNVVEFTRRGRVSSRYVDAIGALADSKHFRSAHKAIGAAGPSDTLYAIDRTSGEIRGHATYDAATGSWKYHENAPLAKTRIENRPLRDAYPRRAQVRVRPHGKPHGVPLTRARRHGVSFVVSSVDPAMLEQVGNRFDPPKPPKADKPDKLPRPGLRYLGHLGLTRTLNAPRRVALLTRNRTAALLGRARAGAALPAAAAATVPLFDQNVLPAGKHAALDFSGHNAVHLLSAAEFGALDAGKHRIYVYDTSDALTYRLDTPRGVLVPDAKGKLTWHDGQNPGAPGVPLESSPIGAGPYGADTHLLLTELTPNELADHARGTRLAALNRRVEYLEGIEQDPSPSTFASLRRWASDEARETRRARNTLKKEIKAATKAAKRQGLTAPAYPELKIRPYQPSLVSTTLVEWKRLYGDGNVPDLFAHLERIDALAKYARDSRLPPLELTDATDTTPPPAIMADAAAWRDTGMPLYVARDWSGGGARYAPVPFSKRAQRGLSTAAATDRALRRAVLGAGNALRNRIVPMSRAYRLSDDPAAFVAQIRRNGGVMPVVTIPIDPHTLNATRGAKHDAEFVSDVKSIGDQKKAKIDYWEGTVTGENGKVMHLDDLTRENLHRWLDAASQAGFLLRLEMAPARALVSSADYRHLAGTNDGYHHHARLGTLLESWAAEHEGQPAPHVMVTFHGWDAVPEPVPGAGHLELLNSLLDRPTLQWVHVGLSYATHGADFIANQELTTALARLLVERAVEEYAQPGGLNPRHSKLARLHGTDALTRVFERVDRDTLADQHQMLLAEIERIGREKGLTPARIAELRQRLYEGNTTRLLNRARYATAKFATDAWHADPKHAPSEKSRERAFNDAWLKDVGALLDAPEQDTTLIDGRDVAAGLQPWREVVRRPALMVDASLPVSDNRLISAQAADYVKPDDPLAAFAELNALRLQQMERSWSVLNWKNVLSGLVGIGAGVAVHHIGLTPAHYKQAANATFVGVRTGRLVQALHQDTLRALQSGDPRLFNHVIDRFINGLNNQLSAHRMDEAQRRESLVRLAAEGRAKINLQLELHGRKVLSADKTVEYTKLLATDMIQQMQGVLAGTSIQQLHHGNPRRFLGKVGRTAAIAGYASLGELSLHTLLQDPSLVPFLGTTGAVLGLTYTGLVQASAFTHLSIERRSRVVRFIDTASDLASIAGGYIAPFVGAAATIHTNVPMAISSLGSATLLALARADTHFPNLTKRVTGKMPTILLLAPIGIYVGNWIYTAFSGSGSSSSNSGNGNTPPSSGATNHGSAPSVPSVPSAPPAPPSGTHAHVAPAAPPTTTPQAPGGAAAQPYIVVAGDSLWVIADRHRQSLLDAAHVSPADQQGMTRDQQDARALKEILQLNPSVANDPNRLPVGAPLIVG
ncbi:LWXIA domain-containing protein [Burkholderia metallica]|uniref:LWXIA domain-containing protein n=2 Tax=Burkholderia metallica TaxID=488729 RepID=UPI00158D90B8|nr:LWXIA domain-containing protein [Burkholderia metallica]